MNGPAPAPGPRDERAHAPGAGPGWSESWGLDFARPDGTGGFVRLRLWPEQRLAWYWAYVVAPDLGLVVVRDHDVRLPRRPGDLEVRADALWAELVCETPLEHWGLALEAFGLRLDEPPDSPGPDSPGPYSSGPEIGERLAVGLDLEWEVVAPPVVDVDGYSQAGVVHGELLVGAARVPFEGPGLRDHTWGELGTWLDARRSRRWCSAGGALDVVVVAGGASSGWRARDGRVEALEDATPITGEPIARASIPLEEATPGARLRRTLYRCPCEDEVGIGWGEALDRPERPLAAGGGGP